MLSALPRPVLVVLGLFALALVLFTKDAPDSWADGSRLGTIQGLVEHRTLALDDTDYVHQGDKVQIAGRYYSHQPPMLAILGSLPYTALHRVFGRAIDDPFTYRILTWLLVGLPVLLGLAALARLLLDAGCDPGWAAAWLFLAAFGTLLLPYSLVLNQHGPAAGLALLGLFAATRQRPATAGVLLALAATIDLTAAFPALAFALPVARGTGFGGLMRYGLCALPVLALHFGVNYSLVGDFKPVGLHLEAFEYPLSPFLIMALTGGGGDELPGTLARYASGVLFGQSGLFSNHPFLLVCVALGLLLPFRRRPAGDGEPRPALAPGVLPAVALAALGIVVFYVLTSRNYGGSAFGVRWFTVFAPLLVLFPAAWQGGRDAPALRTVLGVLGTWSVATAAVGAVQPWCKFAWLPSQRPDALLESPGAERPTLREHVQREWARIRDFRESFDARSYDQWYQELLHRHGRARLKSWPGLTPEQARAWVEEGVEVLQPLVDLLDRANHSSSARPVGHYWLGRFHQRLGHEAAAREAYRKCLVLEREYPPAVAALERLNQGDSPGPP